MAVVVAAGAVGAFDTDPAPITSVAGGWTLTVVAPDRARGGLPLPMSLAVHHDGGFGKDPVRLLISRPVLDQADFQQWYPNPSAETSSGDRVQYEFDPPPGDTLEVHLDARMQPNQAPARLPLTVTLLPPTGGEVTVTRDLVVLP